VKPFDNSGAFRPVSSGGDHLRQLAVRGAGVTLLSGGIALAIQVVATAVLARLLTPADFGLVTMVTTFSLLLANFGFNGLTEAVIQREEINHDLASTLFWINLACGIILTLAFAAAGSLLAAFYHNPLVRGVTMGVSLTIFATSISVLHLALLKRAMRFKHVSINDICARFAAVIVSILLGLAGWGYWALVAGAIALPVSTAIGAFILCRWTPGFPRSVEGTGSTLRFALHTYGNFTVNYFSRNTDNLLVGWRFDARSLGFYKKAYDLFALSASQLVSSISVVIVAALSRVNRDAALYRRYLLGAVSVMAFVGMGLAAGLTLAGKDLIRLLLGPGWEPAGRIFTFFGPGIGVMVIYHTHGWIHLSIGRADRWFRWAIVEFIVTCLLFWIGLPWGPIGIAVAWTVSFWILTVPAIWYAGKPIGLSATTVLSVVWRYLIASTLAGLLTALVMRVIPVLVNMPNAPGAVTRIAVVVVLLVPLYVTSVIVLHGGLEPVYQITRLLREMFFAGNVLGVAPTGVPRASVGETAALNWNGTGGDLPPLVSVLIPAHNAEEWIADTIRSALAQTWPRTEIIVVDDGSTDRTVSIAQRFESQNVVVVEQTNQGASAARNKAFSLCHGDYIQWLDADDLLAPDKIARQMREVGQGISKRTLLSSPWAHFMYRPHRAHFVPTALWCDLSPVEWLLRKMGQNVYMQTATWLVSRELTEAAGPWDILLVSQGVRFVPDAKVYYRAFRFNSLSYIGRFPEKIEAHWLSMQLHIQYLRSLEDSPRVHIACVEFMRDALIYFYPEKNHIVKHAQQIATELGSELGAPYLSWKYSWIQTLFGWHLAKPAQQMLRKFRWTLERHIDKALFLMDGRNPAQNPPSKLAN
jgi:O-antigen/teichoic acid export membrane protein/glycosyltransferase involved in cell wall biosynthesis